jgi:hypothetical protein
VKETKQRSAYDFDKALPRLPINERLRGHLATLCRSGTAEAAECAPLAGLCRAAPAQYANSRPQCPSGVHPAVCRRGVEILKPVRLPYNSPKRRTGSLVASAGQGQ